MKTKSFLIPMVIYPYDVIVSLGQTDRELKKVLKGYNLVWDDRASFVKGGSGRCLIWNNNVLIRTYNYPEYYGTLQHEIFHAVSLILDDIGLKLEIGVSDEAYAYLIGYLTNEIHKRL